MRIRGAMILMSYGRSIDPSGFISSFQLLEAICFFHFSTSRVTIISTTSTGKQYGPDLRSCQQFSLVILGMLTVGFTGACQKMKKKVLHASLCHSKLHGSGHNWATYPGFFLLNIERSLYEKNSYNKYHHSFLSVISTCAFYRDKFSIS